MWKIHDIVLEWCFANPKYRVRCTDIIYIVNVVIKLRPINWACEGRVGMRNSLNQSEPWGSSWAAKTTHTFTTKAMVLEICRTMRSLNFNYSKLKFVLHSDTFSDTMLRNQPKTALHWKSNSSRGCNWSVNCRCNELKKMGKKLFYR